MTSKNYAMMLDSTGERANEDLLRNRIEEEGYLYFRQLVDPDRILRAKNDIEGLLREHCILEDDGNPEPIWSGGPEPTEAEWMAVYDRIVRLESFQDVAHSPEIVSLIEAIYREPVRVWDQQLIRVVYPEPGKESARGIGAHQDGDPKLGYNARTFCTAWVALMDIDVSVGGLAVSPRTHKRGILRSEGAAASSSKDAKNNTYGLDPAELDWATDTYQPGGTVIFACRTVHRGLPNHSDRVRLSGDFRYQPASETASWLTNTLGPDVRRVAQAVDEIVSSRALHVSARPTPEILIEVRKQMLVEKNTTLDRAQELVREIKAADA